MSGLPHAERTTAFPRTESWSRPPPDRSVAAAAWLLAVAAAVAAMVIVGGATRLTGSGL